MTAVRLLSREEIEKRLAPYGCRREKVLADGTELWRTGWHKPFTMKPETDGVYDEWQYTQVVGKVIGPTLPSDWDDKKPYDDED